MVETDATPLGHVSEEALRLVAESAELQFTPDEMHERLIEYEDTLLEYPPGILRPTFEIIADSTIAIEGVLVALSRTKRFFLNALRLSQGFSQTSSEIREMGYEDTGRKFFDEITTLLGTFSALSSEPIIKRELEGKTHTYTLLPEVHIIDRRKDDHSPKARLLRHCVKFDEDGTPLIEDEKVVFRTNAGRAQVTSSLLREFKTTARADQRFNAIARKETRLFGGGKGGPLGFLSRKEEDILVLKKERALVAYVTRPDNPYTEQDLTCIQEGVRACFELFARNLEIVKRYSLRYCEKNLTADEIYQECAAQLIKVVLAHTYDRESIDLSVKIAFDLRQRVITSLRTRANRAAIMFNDRYVATLHALPKIIDEWREEHGHTPSVAELSETTKLNRDTVLGLLALNTQTFPLDDQQEMSIMDESEEPTLLEDDFVDAQLDRVELEDATDTIFASKELNDNEKIVLSLMYEIFHPSLCGAEMVSSDRTKVFTYPYTAEDFYAILGKDQVSAKMLGAQVLGSSLAHISKLHMLGLRKARRLLAADPSFQDLDIMHRTGNTLTLEQEQQQVIARALAISPDKPLDSGDLVTLSKAGRLPNTHVIAELFGSIPEFQKACGFLPKKGLFGAMDNETIVQLALQFSPDKPLRSGTIGQLAKERKFISYSTIKTRFGSIRAFHKACGFTEDES